MGLIQVTRLKTLVFLGGNVELGATKLVLGAKLDRDRSRGNLSRPGAMVERGPSADVLGIRVDRN